MEDLHTQLSKKVPRTQLVYGTLTALINAHFTRVRQMVDEIEHNVLQGICALRDKKRMFIGMAVVILLWYILNRNM